MAVSKEGGKFVKALQRDLLRVVRGEKSIDSDTAANRRRMAEMIKRMGGKISGGH